MSQNPKKEQIKFQLIIRSIRAMFSAKQMLFAPKRTNLTQSKTMLSKMVTRGFHST